MKNKKGLYFYTRFIRVIAGYRRFTVHLYKVYGRFYIWLYKAYKKHIYL